MPGDKFDATREALLWARSPEGEAVLRETLDAQQAARKHLIERAAGRFLVSGQQVKIHGETLIVVKHLDEMPPGHYLAVTDMTGSPEMDMAPAKVIFHPPTVAWVKEALRSPGKMLDDVLQGVALGIATRGQKL